LEQQRSSKKTGCMSLRATQKKTAGVAERDWPQAKKEETKAYVCLYLDGGEEIG
jgi:hypothetical protein